ncbi:MAG: hypothetical protein WCJ72_09220 [Chryseobacterium sp.]
MAGLTEKEFKKLIQKHIAKSNYVKIYLTEESPESYVVGFILNVSDEFLMIQETYDFTLAGIKIIPYEKISSIRHNRFDKTSEKIFSEEGLIKLNQKIIDNTSLKSAESLFKSIKKQNFHCIIDSAKKKKDFFSIGEIIDVNEKSVIIRNYDPTGKINKKPHKISFKNLESSKRNK